MARANEVPWGDICILKQLQPFGMGAVLVPVEPLPALSDGFGDAWPAGAEPSVPLLG